MVPPHSLASAIAAPVPAAPEWSPALAADYWERRARQFAPQGRGLAAVCSYGMPGFYNAYIEHTQRRALLPWLDECVRRPGRRALDLGCGVGRWSLELATRGYDVTGVDVSPSMIARAERVARQRGVRCTFEVADLNTLRLARQFDLIVCVTVLQHVLDPRQAAQGIERLAAHLAPGGRAILLEAAPSRPSDRCNTAVFCARTVQWYRQALQDAGLRVIAESGVDPMPFKTWLLPRYRGLPRPLQWLALNGVTAASWALDSLLAARLVSRSWHKVLVVERDGDREHRG